MAEESGVDELARLRVETWRLRRELAEERRLRELVAGTELVGYLLSSFETNRFLDANQAYCSFLGFSREEILASDPYQFWQDTTFAEDRERELTELKRVVAGEIDGYRIEKRFVHRSGQLRWGEMSYHCLRDARGAVRQAVITCADIHERKAAAATQEKLQGSLLQAQKLESVGRLVGGVAHDFNNRLVVIMGHADLLKRRSEHDPELASHADAVVSSARRAADLTRQLLAYSRRQVLRPQAIDVNALVDGTRRMLERLLGEQIELVTELRARFPMLADPGQVEQVLMNLTLNARDALQSSGRITLRTFDVEGDGATRVEGLTPGAYVALAVSDTGSGISAVTRAHIFEPFFTTKEPGRGTGLGLATVDGIVRQSGGVIHVDSAEGKGSTFTVYLPRASEAPAEVARGPAAAAVTQPEHVPCVPKAETVLVVDDETDVRKLLVDVLSLGGFKVLQASNSREALDLANAHSQPIALLVTDIIMPGESGMELADLLHARNPELKVLFISGYADRERVRPLRSNEQYIPKPFLPGELFQRINELVSGASEHPAGV